MALFNVWHPAQASKTTVIADSPQSALDTFTRRHGFADHGEYLAFHGLTATNLHVEPVH